jgi:predicted nucleotidyltransferase
MVIADEKVAKKIIRDSINEFLPDSWVLLFGSRARHDNTPESDFDLMIITRDTYENKQLRLYKSLIRKKLAQNKIPADIMIQSQAEVNLKKEITGHIIKQILKEGIPL